MNQNQIKSSPDEPPQQSLNIFVENRTSDKFKVNEDVLCKVANFILSAFKLEKYELNITFVSKEEIRHLNNEYRLKDKPTDVLSFPQTEFSSPINSLEQPSHSEIHNILGDLVISLDVAKQNAESIGNSFDKEVAFLVTHGILHLGGHDHINPSEEKVMLSEQRLIVERLEENGPIYSGLVSFAGGLS